MSLEDQVIEMLNAYFADPERNMDFENSLIKNIELLKKLKSESEA
jgi:hypothetical protein